MSTQTFDTYLFIGEEQPFPCFRIDTNSDEAKKMRKLLKPIIKEENGYKSVQLYVTMLTRLRGQDFDNEYDDKRLADWVPDMQKWEKMGDNAWAPIHYKWKSANLILLNTFN